MGAEEVAAWRQCVLSPLCFIRNFPDGSGKFRLARNRSGNFRAIPNEHNMAEKLKFDKGSKTLPENMQKFWEFLHKINNSLHIYLDLFSKVAWLASKSYKPH